MRKRTILISGLLLILGCSSPANVASQQQTQTPITTEGETTPAWAQVTNVEARENQPGQYSFAVTIKSPDTGCNQYADWWEVLSEEGDLLYRRILAHSHVSEQPFQRSGGPVAIATDQQVIVRAHMNAQGYGTQAMKGSIESGFQETQLAPDFAANIESQPPQPNACTG